MELFRVWIFFSALCFPSPRPQVRAYHPALPYVELENQRFGRQQLCKVSLCRIWRKRIKSVSGVVWSHQCFYCHLNEALRVVTYGLEVKTFWGVELGDSLKFASIFLTWDPSQGVEKGGGRVDGRGLRVMECSGLERLTNWNQVWSTRGKAMNSMELEEWSVLSTSDILPESNIKFNFSELWW